MAGECGGFLFWDAESRTLNAERITQIPFSLQAIVCGSLASVQQMVARNSRASVKPSAFSVKPVLRAGFKPLAFGV